MMTAIVFFLLYMFQRQFLFDYHWSTAKKDPTREYVFLSTYFDTADSKSGNRLALSDPVSYRRHYVVGFSSNFYAFLSIAKFR